MEGKPTIRSPVAGDIPGLVELLNACDEVDIGHPDSDAEEVEWRWRIPGFERDRDAWLIALDGEIVAYATVFDAEAEVYVHPDRRGRGLGSQLLRVVEERALEQAGDGVVLKQNITSLAREAHRLLESSGYARAHHYSRMEMDLPARPPDPRPSDGVSIRSFDPRDARPLYDAYCVAWQAYEGEEWTPESYDAWSSAELGGADLDPSLCLLAEESGRIVGFAMCLGHAGDMGWVHRLGTVPERRGRGIGRALMLAISRVYRERGVTRLGLTVSSRNVSSARRLYESLGMTEVLRYDSYRKRLS